MMNSIFDKTEKGREEIATRRHQLAPRLRTLLVMIDGKHDTMDLLKKVTAIGIDEQSFTELLHQGFIAQVTGSAPDHAAHSPSVNAAASAKQETAPAPAVAEAAPTQTSPSPLLPAGENQFQAIYHFYNETIKSTIGLRGYGLQLKVERAASIDDFRALRQAYLDAVLKAKGNEMARSLRDRLDQLLSLDKAVPAAGQAHSETASSQPG